MAFKTLSKTGRRVAFVIAIALLLAVLPFVLGITNISFTAPTPVTNANSTNTSFFMNVSLTSNNLLEFIFDRNSSNFTAYSNKTLLLLNLNNESGIGENDTLVVSSGSLVLNATSNATVNASGKHGNSLTFDGFSSAVNFGNVLNLDSNMTIAAWFYATSSSQQAIVDRRASTSDSYHLHLTSGNQVQFVVDTGSPVTLTSTATVALNTWNHVVAVYNGTNMTLYVNGQLDSITAQTGSMNSASSFVVGRDSPTAANFFNGSLDDISVYNRTLSSDEALWLYASSIQRHSATSWTFQSNVTNLGVGNFSYQAFGVNATGVYNQTERRVFVVTGTGCTPPASGNWAITADCRFTGTASVPGNVSLTGGGNLTVLGNLTWALSSSYVYMNNGSAVVVVSGGQFG